MMGVGILAATGRQSDTGPVTLGAIDFVNGVYAIDGSTYAASDIVDKPDRIGASGLEILEDDFDGVVEAIGPLLALLVSANWSLVLEYQELTSTFSTNPIWLGDAPAFENTLYIERRSPGAGLLMEASETTNILREVQVSGPFGPAVYKVGLTRTPSKLALCVDGGGVEAQILPQSLAATRCGFGGEPSQASGNGTFIRSLTVYAPLADAQLQALTA